MVCPGITSVPGVNWRTGRAVEPESWLPKLKMDVKAAIAVAGAGAAGTMMAGAVKPADKTTSVLDDILKPPVMDD